MDLSSNAWPIVTSVVSSCVLVAFGLSRVLKAFRSVHQEAQHLRRELRKHVVLIGIPAGTRIPNVLKPLPDFINVKDAIIANVPFAILHTRTLSYALRHCDFVCYRSGSDPAIHTEDSPFWSDLIDAKDSEGGQDRPRCLEYATDPSDSVGEVSEKDDLTGSEQ